MSTFLMNLEESRSKLVTELTVLEEQFSELARKMGLLRTAIESIDLLKEAIEPVQSLLEEEVETQETLDEVIIPQEDSEVGEGVDHPEHPVPSESEVKADQESTQEEDSTSPIPPSQSPIPRVQKYYGLTTWATKFFEGLAPDLAGVTTLEEALEKVYGSSWRNQYWIQNKGPGKVEEVPFIKFGQVNPKIFRMAQTEFKKIQAAMREEQLTNRYPSERIKKFVAKLRPMFEANEATIEHILTKPSDK